MKTFDKKDVFSWSNSEEAKTYIGKTGYFNNDFEGMKRAIELGGPAVLGRVDTNSIWCFEGLGVSLCFGLFLPADKIKGVEEPKKWREFKDIEEFKKETGFHVGSCVLLRVKDLNGIIVSKSETLITDIDTIYDNKTREVLDYMIYLGTDHYQFSELLNTFEYFNFTTNKWQPFGVEE